MAANPFNCLLHTDLCVCVCVCVPVFVTDADVEVEGVPVAPLDVRCHDANKDYVVVTWKQPAVEGSSSILGYFIDKWVPPPGCSLIWRQPLVRTMQLIVIKTTFTLTFSL